VLQCHEPGVLRINRLECERNVKLKRDAVAALPRYE